MFGASMVVGGKLAGTQIRLLGPRGHTTLSNICTIIAFVIFGQVIELLCTQLPRHGHSITVCVMAFLAG
jgi:hypothetical protein